MSESYLKTDGEALKWHLKDAGITTVVLLLAIYFFTLTSEFADVTASTGDPGAAFWPRIVLGVMIIASTANLGIIAYRIKTNTAPSADSALADVDDESTSDTETEDNRLTYLSTIGLLLLYVGLLDTVGFVVLTPFFLIITGWNVGYRSPIKLVVFGFVTGVVLQVVFRNFFNIVLPRGAGIFRGISLFFEGLI
ncbi:tripartite tricarboxylate transporter TctB family protein [Natrinema salinisoli]|uniref:tripartite tricarboxylate transporter TctB family protein n=1 Tax=Natrinema salinisoli TaxID=2878535 RepID=UPI001CF0C9A3|nr:tripartite tricarboxylate transporter TctB family protein [Natrinema salinisoli]